jgi:hypothetical protein
MAAYGRMVSAGGVTSVSRPLTVTGISSAACDSGSLTSIEYRPVSTESIWKRPVASVTVSFPSSSVGEPCER